MVLKSGSDPDASSGQIGVWKWPLNNSPISVKMELKRVFWAFFLLFWAPSHELQTFVQGKALSIPDGVVSVTSGEYEINHDFNRINYNLQILDESNGRKQVNFGIVGSNNDKDELVKRLIIKILQDRLHDAIDIYDEKGVLMGELTCNLNFDTPSSTGELVNFVTDACVPLCTLSRSIIHKYNLLHCGIGCLIFNNEGNQLFVHKRSKLKRLFPSMLDMFIGGVCSSGESPEVTLLRELSEEVGLDFISTKSPIINGKIVKSGSKSAIWDSNAFAKAWNTFKSTERYGELFSSSVDKNVVEDGGGKVKYLGRCTIYTSYNHCIVYVYAVTTPISQVISFRDGEIDEGTFMTLDKLQNLLEHSRDEFVPDGLQVWDEIPNLL